MQKKSLTGKFQSSAAKNSSQSMVPQKVGLDRPSTQDILKSLSDNHVYIPISVDKKPVVSEWKPLTSTPKHLIRGNLNIAIRTGFIDSDKNTDITVVDFDFPKPNIKDPDKIKLDGLKKYDEFIEEYCDGEPIETPTCRTQSGGIHWYFKYDPEIKTSAGFNGYSIDVRNDNGLIICPPSIGVKGPYTWMNDKSIENTELMEIPNWLKNWLLKDSEYKIEQKNEKKNEKKEKNKKEKKNSKNKKINEFENKAKKYMNGVVEGVKYLYEVSDIVGLLENLPKKYVNSYSFWIVVTACLKSEGLKIVWDDWSKTGTGYDTDNNFNIWNTLDLNVDLMFLCVIAAEENMDKYRSVVHVTRLLKFLSKEANTKINSEFITDTKLCNITDSILNNIMLKSVCGSGKTKFSCKNIKDLCEKTNKRLLSISVRISMAYQQMADFKEEKFTVTVYKFLNSEILNAQQYLIIQLDSIHKLDLHKWYGAIIYLDETSALLSYLISSTTITDKNRILSPLAILLQNASQIICTDADLNDIVLTYFDKMNINYSFIQNDYVSDVIKPAYEYEDREYMITLMEKELSDNKPFFVCFDTKVEMDLIVERLKKYCEDNKFTKQVNNFLCYSSEEGDMQDCLIVNEKWKSKFIFYTPKITICVSFVNKTPRKIYLFSKGLSINAFQLIQQMSRCRNVSELHYFIVKKYHTLKYHCPEDVKKEYTELIKDFSSGKSKYQTKNVYASGFHDISNEFSNLKTIMANGFFDLVNGTKTMVLRDHIFNDMFYLHEYYNNVLCSAQREHFRWMLEGKNFKVTNIKQCIDDKAIVDVKVNIKHANVKVKEKHKNFGLRALYDKESSLTYEEKLTKDKAKKRAEFLGIDFDKKVQKKKCEDYLINDIKFTQHYVFRMLYNDEKYNVDVKKNCSAQITANVLAKIKLIKELEKILDVKTLDIDTQRDSGRFEEIVVVSDSSKADIKREFRVTKKNEDETYKFWYYQLIQMYKNLFGDHALKQSRTQKNGVRNYEYSINNDFFTQEISLSNAQIKK
jgi:hypothetical protein